jgi:hypothetical protein
LRRSKVPDTLIPTVIQASSPDPRGNIEIDWNNPADKPADVPRCSPYQLHLYMDWAREDPPPDPAMLAGAAEGHYVELRILQRLNNNENLVRLLPMVSLLGHFDRDSLNAGAGLNAQEFNPAFEALEEQDWIASRLVSTGPDSPGRRVLDVEKSIRDRMRIYFERRGRILPAARRRSAAFLQKRTLTDPLEGLEWTDYDAALRASEADLAQAVTWWQQLETRLLDAYLAEKQNPEGLHLLLQTLSGRDGACGMRDPQAGAEVPPENRMRPYVLAALAAVQQYMPEPARRRDTWRQVEEIVSRQAGADGSKPLDPASDRLLRLALAGQVAVARDPASDLDGGLVSRYLSAVERANLQDFQESAAHSAALEALIERAERQEGPTQPEKAISSHLRRLFIAVSAGPGVSRLYCWICSLLGRAYCLDQTLEPALSSLRSSLLELNEKDTPYSYRYWKQPEDLAARLKLEFVRAAFPLMLSPAEVLAAIPIQAGIPRSVDQERLLAAGIRVRTCDSAPALEELSAWMKSQEIDRPCTCNAHRDTPPLVVALAEALFAAGRVDDAMQKLQETSSPDFDTRRWVSRARVELSIRMRQWNYGRSPARLLQESNRSEDLALLLRVRAVEGPTANQSPLPGAPDPHLSWQTSVPPADPDRLAEWLSSWNDRLTAALADAKGLLALEALQLDLSELNQIAQTGGISFDRSGSGQRWSPANWGERISSAMAYPQAGLRLVLRLRELVVPRPVPQRGVISGYGSPESFDSTQLDYLHAQLVARLGSRQAGEIALEEAGLLGLHLPSAETLWSAAAGEFRKASDAAGEFRALLDQLVQFTASAKTLAEAKKVGQLSAFKRCAEVYATLPDVPTLADLDGFFAGPTPHSNLIAFLKPSAWVPWQAAWVAVRTIARGDNLAPLRLEIEPAFGRSAGGNVLLPREWEQLLRFSDSLVGSNVADKQPAPQSGMSVTLIVVIVLAIAAAVLVGGYFLLLWLGGPTLQSYSTGFKIGFYIAILVILYVSVLIVGGFRARWNAFGFYELEIRPHQEQRQEASRGAAELRLHLARWAPRIFPLPPRLGYKAIAEEQILAAPGSTAAGLSEAIQDKDIGAALLKAAAPQRASIPVMVRIKLSSDAASPAWEAALAYLVRGDENKPSRLKMRFIRVMQGSRKSAVKNANQKEPMSVGGLAADTANQQVINQAWSQQAKRGAISIQIVNDIVSPQPKIQILHIIARIENQLGGPVLNFSSVKTSSTNIGFAELRKTSDWLSPDQLLRVFPNLTLCLLQGDPADTMETYADSSILTAEKTRRFAADLAVAGIDVLVLPPLPIILAADLSSRLARIAPAYSRRGSAALAAELRSLQDRIYSGIKNQPAGWNLAQDICLYANDLPNPSIGDEMLKKMEPFEASMLEQKAKNKKSEQ